MRIADIVSAAGALKSPRFSLWLKFILDHECEFYSGTQNIRPEKVSGDSGGLTFAGIDQASHPGFPFDYPTPAAIVDVYWNRYWLASRAPDLAWPVGEVTANFAVNMGLGRAAWLLQTAINQIPGGGSCRVDRDIGPKTIEASKLEDPRKLADIIEDQADLAYRGIAANPTRKKFLAGWLRRDDELEQWWMKLGRAPG
jgi:lysozyme family protein